MPFQKRIVFFGLFATYLAYGVCARPIITYENLEPLANVVDIRGIWKALKLPQLPETFCHVGLVGWHCHNTTMHPWNPASIFPKDKTPPMPANASCVICPEGWHGPTRNIIDVLIDIPMVQRSGKLPQGFYNMTELLQAAEQPEADLHDHTHEGMPAVAAAAAAAATAPSSNESTTGTVKTARSGAKQP